MQDANLIIVNTCTVTHVADAKTRKTVRSVCKKNTLDTSKIIVTGCAAAIYSDFYVAIDSRIQFVSKLSMIGTLAGLIGEVSTSAQANILAGENFRTRASIKVQDGCDNACTYCIVHVARGKSTSVPASDVVAQAKALLNAGVKEINLTGVNIGAYCDGDINLAKLLNELVTLIEHKFANYSGIPARFRLGSIEPQDFSDKLIEVIAAAQGKICRHFHLPLQSGSSKVLGQMNRRYTADAFLQLVHKIKEAMPTASFSTDVICGFPGETDDDFSQTLEVCKQCRFMKIHVFPYSMRKNTPAAQRDDQIDPKIKNARCKQLQELGRALAKQDLEKRKGEFGLIEAPNRARLESYHLIKCDSIEIGSLVKFS